MTVVELSDKDKEIKEQHWQKLNEKILKSKETLKDIPEPIEPTYEQKSWFVRRMKRRFT